MLELGQTFGKSFTYRENKSGHKIEPCGTTADKETTRFNKVESWLGLFNLTNSVIIFRSIILNDILYWINKIIIKSISSLSVGHYELCRDDIGDLPGSPEHLWLRENANEIG